MCHFSFKCSEEFEDLVSTVTIYFCPQMRKREDKLQGEGETDPGSDPGSGAVRCAHPPLRHQRHW